jgi:purine operon repressor
MKKIQKSERIGIISHTLTENPNYLYTFNYFCDLFQCAKSTISEDIDTVKELFKVYELGQVETVAGAAGGVYYNPVMSSEKLRSFTETLCEKLKSPDRMIGSGYIYTNDILYSPTIGKQMGLAMASLFQGCELDYIITVETKGIPLAMMTARILNKPLVVVRNQSKLTDGTVIYMNYITGSNHRIKTMCLSTRAIKKGSKVLFIDDFMKAGGTAKGIFDLMQAFEAEIVGVGVLMATKQPEQKVIKDFKTLLWLESVDEINKEAIIYSALPNV